MCGTRRRPTSAWPCIAASPRAHASSFPPSLLPSFVRSVGRSLAYPFARSLISSFALSPLQSCRRSFTCRSTIDTVLQLIDGTYAEVRIVHDKHGKTGYMSVKLPRPEGQDTAAVVAAAERTIERIEPKRFQLGRCAAAKLASGMRSDDGSATSTIAP